MGQLLIANPYAVWQRGRNENTNVLARQCFAKGCNQVDFSDLYSVSRRQDQSTATKTIRFQNTRIALQPIIQPCCGPVLMDALKTAGYDGRNAVVLVIGDAASASAARKRSSQLPTAQWLSARTAASLKALDLAGTPAVLGIDVGQRIVWQESGTPQRIGDLAVRISDWTRP